MPHRLVFFPDYRAANPYQRLLYDHSAVDLDPQPGTIAEALARRAQQAPDAGMIFHLHWEDGVYRNEPDEAAARAVAERFALDLERFVDGGGMVLWTLHNEAPHEDRYPAVQAELRAAVLRLVDLVHVHGLEAARFARFELGIAAERLVIVPHGNYRPRYAPLAGPPAASRAALGLPAQARVLLLFGRLDAYKGVAEVLEAIARLDREELWLLIAGQQVVPLDEPLARLPKALRERIVVEPGPVPDARIPLLFHAADALVAPYRRILTSGAAMLALSLGRPVLAPAHPGLAELVRDGREGLLWEPADPEGLERTLLRFLSLDATTLERLGAGAAARAELFDWRTIGNLVAGVFARLLALRRPLRRIAT